MSIINAKNVYIQFVSYFLAMPPLYHLTIPALLYYLQLLLLFPKNENTMYLHCQPPLTMSQLCCLSYVSRMGPIYGLKNLRYLYKSPAAKIFSQNNYSTTTTTTSTTPSAGGTGRACLARWLAAIICACIWCLWFMFRGFAKLAFGDTCLNTTKKHTWSPYRTHTRITCDVSIYINISLLVCFSWMSMVFAHTIYAF